MTLEPIIEGILFFKAEPVLISYLARMLERSEGDIRTALDSLARTLTGRGLVLVRTNETVSLGTAPEVGDFIKKIVKDELAGELTKADRKSVV